jgi:hypothetical protein
MICHRNWRFHNFKNTTTYRRRGQTPAVTASQFNKSSYKICKFTTWKWRLILNGLQSVSQYSMLEEPRNRVQDRFREWCANIETTWEQRPFPSQIFVFSVLYTVFDHKAKWIFKHSVLGRLGLLNHRRWRRATASVVCFMLPLLFDRTGFQYLNVVDLHVGGAKDWIDFPSHVKSYEIFVQIAFGPWKIVWGFCGSKRSPHAPAPSASSMTVIFRTLYGAQCYGNRMLSSIFYFSFVSQTSCLATENSWSPCQ